MNRAALLLCLAATVSTSSLGCAKLREKLSGKAHDKTTDSETATETATTSAGNGTITTGGTKLPEGWPSSVPAYPGASITAAMATPQGKTAVMTTKDAPGKVHDFYKDKLSSMKLQSDVDLGGTKAMSFRSGTTTVSVTVTPGSASDSNITVSVAGKL